MVLRPHAWSATFVRRQLLDAVEYGHKGEDFLARYLPASWQRLIWRYGQHKVMDCIRRGMTLGGAMYYLREGKRP